MIAFLLQGLHSRATPQLTNAIVLSTFPFSYVPPIELVSPDSGNKGGLQIAPVPRIPTTPSGFIRATSSGIVTGSGILGIPQTSRVLDAY
jgi:hypothetical protein